jgi:hypothetical protein
VTGLEHFERSRSVFSFDNSESMVFEHSRGVQPQELFVVDNQSQGMQRLRPSLLTLIPLECFSLRGRLVAGSVYRLARDLELNSADRRRDEDLDP